MNDLTAKINCPNCGRQIRLKIKEMVPGRSKRLSCGCVVQFTGDDGRQAQKALDDFQKSLKQLNRKLKIRL